MKQKERACFRMVRSQTDIAKREQLYLCHALCSLRSKHWESNKGFDQNRSQLLLHPELCVSCRAWPLLGIPET